MLFNAKKIVRNCLLCFVGIFLVTGIQASSHNCCRERCCEMFDPCDVEENVAIDSSFQIRVTANRNGFKGDLHLYLVGPTDSVIQSASKTIVQGNAIDVSVAFPEIGSRSRLFLEQGTYYVVAEFVHNDISLPFPTNITLSVDVLTTNSLQDPEERIISTTNVIVNRSTIVFTGRIARVQANIVKLPNPF